MKKIIQLTDRKEIIDAVISGKMVYTITQDNPSAIWACNELKVKTFLQELNENDMLYFLISKD